MKNFLNKLFPRKIQDALIDTRPFSERQKNWLDIEFAMGDDEYDYKEEDLSKPYEIEDGDFYPHDQDSSLSCVALGDAMWKQEFARRAGRIFIGSRKDVYFRRFNKPAGGMAMFDLINIARAGSASEEQVPSQGLGEIAMNRPYAITTEILETRKLNRIKGAVYIANRSDIDQLAKASRNSPVSIFLAFDSALQWQEFWIPFPRVINKSLNLFANSTSRHQVTLPTGGKVLGGVLINGKKHLKIQDSSALGTGYGKNKNIRYLSEEFIKARVYEATYAIPNDIVIDKPKSVIWTGKRNLKLGMVGDDVRRLQEILQIEDCFDFPNPTGYFGGITRAGVIKLQNKYKNDILTPVGLKFGTGFVGNSTLSFLKNKYK